MQINIDDVSKEQVSKICFLYEKKKLSLSNTAKEMDLSVPVVRKILVENGVRLRKQGEIAATIRTQRILELVEQAEKNNQKPINCDKQGKHCVFRAKAEWKCNYCGMVGRIRGGDPKECTKYVMRGNVKKGGHHGELKAELHDSDK